MACEAPGRVTVNFIGNMVSLKAIAHEWGFAKKEGDNVWPHRSIRSFSLKDKSLEQLPFDWDETGFLPQVTKSHAFLLSLSRKS